MPCLNPRRMTLNGLAREFACQKCLECRKGRVRDLSGRALAEKLYCVGSHFVTLTYGVDRRVDGASDVPGAVVLTYSHIKNWLKRLRNAGYPARYIVAGEYGSKKGRCHWHVILYWTKKVPPVPAHVTGQDGHPRCWDDPFWKPIGGGHTRWDEVTEHTARYISKYCLKDTEDPHAQTIVRRSTRPMIGARYFDHWARLHVEQGLAIKDRLYRIPGSVDKATGMPWNYYMTDAALAYVVRSYARQWRAANGSRHMPPDAFLEEQLDKLAYLPPDMSQPRPAVKFKARPHLPPPNGETVFFDEVQNEYYYELGRTGRRVPDDPVRVWWTFDQHGHREWSFDFVSVPEGERRLREFVSGASGRRSDDYRAATARSSRGLARRGKRS